MNPFLKMLIFISHPDKELKMQFQATKWKCMTLARHSGSGYH